jgi:2-octaprenyl-6-methoxyphenol hydroxylase
MAAQSFDFAIIGGGPVGLSMALALTRSMSGLRIALVDRRTLSVPKDERASAIAAGVRRVFEELGVWSRVADLAEPVRQMKITDSGTGDMARPLFLRFEGDVAPGEPYAHLVPNSALAKALLDGVQDQITDFAPAVIAKVTTGPASTQIDLEDGTSFTAALVIAADGVNSAMRERAGIGTHGHDYGQAGVVATIAHTLPHEGTAFEHFRPAGPFASLPLPGNRSSLVWTETLDEAARLKALPPAALAREIETAMGSSLGAVTLESAVEAYPLRLRIARTSIGPRLALIGDAAHVVHPIAGQGLNLGLKDVAALAEVLVEALRLGLDPGAPDVLARYERWRRLDVAVMAMVTDGMNRLFSNDLAPVRALRDLGLGVVDRIGPLKGYMIAKAAGIDRSGPRLLRGLPI